MDEGVSDPAAAGRAAKPGERGPKERVCATCGTTLSAYNAGPHCWQHTVGWPWRGPSAKPRY
jgi:hypothetical protein